MCKIKVEECSDDWSASFESSRSSSSLLAVVDLSWRRSLLSRSNVDHSIGIGSEHFGLCLEIDDSVGLSLQVDNSVCRLNGHCSVCRHDSLCTDSCRYTISGQYQLDSTVERRLEGTVQQLSFTSDG